MSYSPFQLLKEHEEHRQPETFPSGETTKVSEFPTVQAEDETICHLTEIVNYSYCHVITVFTQHFLLRI